MFRDYIGAATNNFLWILMLSFSFLTGTHFNMGVWHRYLIARCTKYNGDISFFIVTNMRQNSWYMHTWILQRNGKGIYIYILSSLKKQGELSHSLVHDKRKIWNMYDIRFVYLKLIQNCVISLSLYDLYIKCFDRARFNQSSATVPQHTKWTKSAMHGH